MFLNISPLRQYRDYRLLYIGQLVSFLGGMVSYVAIPYEVYELTHDNAMVGFVSLAQLFPVLIFGLLGGTYADRLNRRRLLITCELSMVVLLLGLAWNGSRPEPSIPLVFILVAILQAVFGFHRPAFQALTQALVQKKDYAAVGALSSFRSSFGAIAGPSLGGVLIATYGVQGAYIFDACTFLVAFACLMMMHRVPNPRPSQNSPWSDAKEGLKFALSKPELVGTYAIDIVAMVFAFPVALFPAMSQNWGGATAAGILFSSMATGSFFITVFSGWTGKVAHHGRAVVIAASLWALFVIGVGFADSLWTAFGFLALAGAADMVSGLFRGVIWNETVPNEFRGRLSGIEMISYMSGPLLGNARAGWMAAQYSVPVSLYTGGIVCFVAVIFTAKMLPRFWRYKSTVLEDATSSH